MRCNVYNVYSPRLSNGSIDHANNPSGDRFSDDPACGIKCYRAFQKTNFLPSSSIQIRGPGPLGYAAFLSPDAPPIAKNSYVGEYLGELLPTGNSSLYGFEIPGIGMVDAERAGNWTRFSNSHCRPNVKVWGDFVGKRRVILFQTLREVRPGEELTWSYGRAYFEKAGFLCGCDAVEGGHLPGGGEKKRRDIER